MVFLGVWLWLLWLLVVVVGRNHQSPDLLQYRGECHLAPSCRQKFRTQVGGQGRESAKLFRAFKWIFFSSKQMDQDAKSHCKICFFVLNDFFAVNQGGFWQIFTTTAA